MRAIEFDFDSYLLDLCKMVQHNVETDDNPGMVAACIIDPDGNTVARTSVRKGDKWVHAERNAIEHYEKEFGKVPPNSTVIVTLSPCNERTDDTANERDGASCTDYLNSKGIKTVYVGYMDPTQDNDQAGFNQISSNNKTVKKLCKKFAKTFLPLKECKS